jgi:type IV pilus assembly protein PilQ
VSAEQPKPVQARPVPQPVQAMPTVPVPATNAQAVRPAVGQSGGARATSTWRSEAGFTEDTTPKLDLTTTSRRINLDVQGADIRTVLRTLADYAGMNIIASRDVQGEVSASLKDAPWESALESILRAHGYGYVQENGIIRVGLLEKIRNEELEEAAAARKREDLLPIETRVVHVEFANADELKSSLQEMLTSRGNLQVDSRTNALIITDIPNRVELIGQMAQQLDSRTPQVEIVSKIVDVSKTDARNLGIEWSATNIMHGDVLGGAGVSAPVPGAAGGLRLGTVQSWGQLDLMLDALASKKKANVISNPTITTVNNREAKILVGSKIPLIVADEAGNAITQLTTIGIQMRVTPHVNSDNTISLDLHPEISELSSQATVQGGVIINTSEADTRVIVNDGETAIIGGLIRDIESEVKTGIPVLQDIPLVGWLFRNSNITDDKRELIIFVTPRMINGEIGQG